jgi:oligopeptide transport system ATP-binding protein
MPDMPPLLDVQGLSKHYPFTTPGFLDRRHGVVRAVDGVSFDIARGETLGLVGESGSGKTTVGRAILHLTRATGGKILFDGTDLAALDDEALRQMRRRMQIIFQDSHSSLNGRMSVREIVGEPLETFRLLPKAQIPARVAELLELVGLSAAHATRNPHEFSGGQRQRIGIARALAVSPDFIVCDEPTSALDVSIQAQILNLLSRLKRELGLTYLFISHDLSVVRHLCDRVAVMYMGKIVEIGTGDDLFSDPRHPYTRALIAAVPEPDPVLMRARARTLPVSGEPPSPLARPQGCAFRTRCPIAQPICAASEPPLLPLGGRHLSACHFAADLPDGVS